MKRQRTTANPREAAWWALCDYDTRHPPWEGLLHRALRGLEGSDRRLAAELLTGVLRHRRRLDHELTRAVGRGPAAAEPPVWNLLRLGAYQMLLLERVPDHAAVSEMVELTKRHHPRAAGFVNAALRALQRAGPTHGMAPEVLHSLPDRLADVLRGLLPEPEWDSALQALNDPGPLGLRFNPLAADPVRTAERMADLLDEPLDPHPAAPGAFTCARSHLESLRPLLDEGALVVQDPASQMVAHLVAPRPGQRIVDLCAAPGGKTAHLAALMENRGVIVATDRDRGRLRELQANLERLGATCAEVVDWGLAEMLLAAPEPDVVLVDAPCTGWGTVRHKPDLKWRPHAPSKLAESQSRLLDHAASHLAPGGVLIHSVCTFLPEETTQLVHSFLERHPGFRIQDAREVLPMSVHGIVEEEGWVRTWPHRHRCDGFFAVRLLKT